MNIFNKNHILLKAKSKLYNGLFREGYLFLKKEKYKFFLLNNSLSSKAEYFYLYGVFLANNGFYRRSILYLKKSLLYPDLDKSEILYYIIFSYLNLSNTKKVKYYFNKISERSFDPFFILLSYYICIKNNINLNISLDSLKYILPDTSDQIMDALTIALYHLLENKFDLAYDSIKIFHNKYKDYFFYNVIYLKILFKRKNYTDILNYFKINSEYLVNIDILFIFSATLYKIKFFDECIKILNEVLFLNKNFIKATINLGKINYLKGKYILAINYFKSALKKTMAKYKDEIHFYLSICCQRLGLLNDSIIYLKKISPDSDFYCYALFNLSLLNYDLCNYKNAKEIFSQINKEKISKDLYNKWEERIKNIDKKIGNGRILNKIIYFIPWLILIFSFLVLIIFYFIVKY